MAEVTEHHSTHLLQRPKLCLSTVFLSKYIYFLRRGRLVREGRYIHTHIYIFMTDLCGTAEANTAL